MGEVWVWVGPVVAVGILTAVAFAVVSAMRLEQPWLQPWAMLRAAVQLGLLSLVLHYVIGSVLLVGAFLAVMVVAASWMVVSRLKWGLGRWPIAAGIIASSALVPGLIAFGTGAIALRPNLLLALGGIIVGNMMTISTLFARTLCDRLRAEWDQVEGWLALGATPRVAARSSVRASASLALMPTTDQTRVTGIVTLPGAFVGAVFGGLPVAEAAVFQLVVLSSILAGGSIAIALWTRVLGAPRSIRLTPEPAKST